MRNYFVQLDALRCIAVFAVIFHHLPLNDGHNILGAIFDNISGVDIFFCLSGFLITGILLQLKERKIGLWRALKIFYIRRFFRIFPIYYLAIFFLIVVNPNHYREYFLYDLFYLSNFKMGLEGRFIGITPHFWSLAVEEQYYLISPLAILISPFRFVFTVLLLATIAGAFFIVASKGTSSEFYYARTFANLFYLGAGGLAAYWYYYAKDFFKVLTVISNFVLIFYLALVGTVYICELRVNETFYFFMKFTFCFFLVIKFVDGFKGVFKKVLEAKPIIYLGKISYGLYLYHFLMFIPLTILNKASIKLLQYDLMGNIYLSNFYKIVLTVVVASISWKFIEQPIQKLKDKFSY